MEEDNVLDKLRGEGLSKLVEAYFKRMLEDPRVKNRYLNKDLEDLKTKYENYLENLLSKGTEEYSGRSMQEAHSGLGLTQHEMDVAITHWEDAALECGLTASTTQIVTTYLTSVRSEIEGK